MKLIQISLLGNVLVLFATYTISSAIEEKREEIDKVIEDDITQKLTEDLLQSIEKKFHIDLEKSVDVVLQKIKTLLQNGTAHIQETLMKLQNDLSKMKENSKSELESCLIERQNETTVLAEKALHQMVLCGYALIGHDPAQALARVMQLKQKIKDGLKPLGEKRTEIVELIKVCGHEHDTLKKVIKCVISKSPLIKTAMMEVTGKLIEGVIELTKLMAHGAMHEACLIEVVKTIEDDAIILVVKVGRCVFGDIYNENEELKKYVDENNATVLNIPAKDKKKSKLGAAKEVNEMKELIRRMLSPGQDIDKSFKKKLQKLEKHLTTNKNSV